MEKRKIFKAWVNDISWQYKELIIELCDTAFNPGDTGYCYHRVGEDISATDAKHYFDINGTRQFTTQLHFTANIQKGEDRYWFGNDITSEIEMGYSSIERLESFNRIARMVFKMETSDPANIVAGLLAKGYKEVFYDGRMSLYIEIGYEMPMNIFRWMVKDAKDQCCLEDCFAEHEDEAKAKIIAKLVAKSNYADIARLASEGFPVKADTYSRLKEPPRKVMDIINELVPPKVSQPESVDAEEKSDVIL
jgi:hypothetical protein